MTLWHTGWNSLTVYVIRHQSWQAGGLQAQLKMVSAPLPYFTLSSSIIKSNYRIHIPPSFRSCFWNASDTLVSQGGGRLVVLPAFQLRLENCKILRTLLFIYPYPQNNYGFRRIQFDKKNKRHVSKMYHERIEIWISWTLSHCCILDPSISVWAPKLVAPIKKTW